MAEGTPQTENIFRQLAQRVVTACRTIAGGSQPTFIDRSLPYHMQEKQARRAQLDQRYARQASPDVLDAGKDAVTAALRDGNLSRTISDPQGRPIGNVLTPAGMERVLASGMIPDAAIATTSHGDVQNVGQARAILARNDEGSQRLAADFTGFMQTFQPGRAAQAYSGPAAINQVCTTVESITPLVTPRGQGGALNPFQGGFGQPPRRN